MWGEAKNNGVKLREIFVTGLEDICEKCVREIRAQEILQNIWARDIWVRRYMGEKTYGQEGMWGRDMCKRYASKRYAGKRCGMG